MSELADWFTLNNPFLNTKQLVSIAFGSVGNYLINCHRNHYIDLESMVKITCLNFNNAKLNPVHKFLQTSAVNKSIKDKKCKVCVVIATLPEINC